MRGKLDAELGICLLPLSSKSLCEMRFTCHLTTILCCIDGRTNLFKTTCVVRLKGCISCSIVSFEAPQSQCLHFMSAVLQLAHKWLFFVILW